jgi:hypothetical protein
VVLLDRWWNTLPQTVAKVGLVVPISQMPPHQLAGLLRAHHEGGDDATLAFVRRQYDDIFGRPSFLADLKTQWQADPFLKRRFKPLSQALEAHAAGLFSASVPTLIAQLEGLIADLSGHKGQMNGAAWVRLMDEIASQDPLAGKLVAVFATEILTGKFAHGGDVASPLSRHAILHGGDVDYGTETNSRTAILIVDYFACVSRIQRRFRSFRGEQEAVGPAIKSASVSPVAPTPTEARPVSSPAPAATGRRAPRRGK